MLLVGLLCPLTVAARAAPGDGGAPTAASKGAEAQNQASPAEAIPQSALPGGQAALFGRLVEQVRVLGTSGDLKQNALLEVIPLKAGERLERENVRGSLRALFGTGRFAEAEAEASLLPSGGVAVEFRTKPNYFNGAVTVTGLPKIGPNETQVVNTGRLELGAQFTEEKLKDSESRILGLLHDHGYWKARVGADLDFHDDTQQVDVEFQVLPGAVAQVGKLTVVGDPGLSAEETAEICKVRPGARVRGDLLQRALARLRKRYVKQRRLRAQLTASVPVFHRGKQYGGLHLRGGARAGGGHSRRRHAVEPRQAEALCAGLRRARGG